MAIRILRRVCPFWQLLQGTNFLKISGDTGRRVLHVGALVLFLLSLTALILNQPVGAGGAVFLAAGIGWIISRREKANRFWGSIGLIYIFICALAIFEIRGLDTGGTGVDFMVFCCRMGGRYRSLYCWQKYWWPKTLPSHKSQKNMVWNGGRPGCRYRHQRHNFRYFFTAAR